MVRITKRDIHDRRIRGSKRTRLMCSCVVIFLIYGIFCNYLLVAVTQDEPPQQEKPTPEANRNHQIDLPSTADRSGSAISRILDIPKLITNAGVDLTQEIIQDLPTNEQVFKLYGEGPQIIGLETCPAFRQSVPPEEAYIGAAGMFNTGTNLLSKLLRHHCAIPEREAKYASLPDLPNNNAMKTGINPHVPRGKNAMKTGINPQVSWAKHAMKTGINPQVPWGKHNPVSWRNHHVAKLGGLGVVQDNVLPVVMIKDPYHWMGSMCRHPYSAQWRHFAQHCPNLVNESVKDAHGNAKSVKVHLNYQPEIFQESKFYEYESLADLWSTWYTDYLDANEFPRLMIRYEDLLFYPTEVVTAVCECGGGKLINADNGIHHVEESAKKEHYKNSAPVGLLSAIQRYGKEDHRTDTMTEEDLSYARAAFSSDLMDLFHYSHPE